MTTDAERAAPPGSSTAVATADCGHMAHAVAYSLEQTLKRARGSHERPNGSWQPGGARLTQLQQHALAGGSLANRGGRGKGDSRVAQLRVTYVGWVATPQMLPWRAMRM